MIRKSLIKIALTCLSTAFAVMPLVAQYKGAPVKKDRLVKALRSKQLQTRDIVTVISTNGVDFALTAETSQQLIAAGARPEVIRAVADNPRLKADASGVIAKNRRAQNQKPSAPDYEELLDQAMFSFKERDNPRTAVRALEAAMKLSPKNPAAYQMLGFINLYGLKNQAQAERLMREAIAHGGSAVFRVYHDDSGGFSGRCTGSLYLSSESIRYESDDNLHTFETSVFNVDKFSLDTESNREWKKHSTFKILLKIGKDKTRFRFAPVSGSASESQMVERMILVSKITRESPAAKNFD